MSNIAPDAFFNVFVSSTARDLSGVYRDGIREAILSAQLHPIMMENFNPTEDNAVQLCYDKVKKAHIFVGVYAYRYGYTPSSDIIYNTENGARRCSGSTSITHMEYEWALERKLPLLLFLVDDALRETWDTAQIDDEPNASRLEAFKTLVKARHVVAFFKSPDELARKVTAGLTEASSKLAKREKIQRLTALIRAGKQAEGLTAVQDLLRLSGEELLAAEALTTLINDPSSTIAMRVLAALQTTSPQTTFPTLVINALRQLADTSPDVTLAGGANKILRGHSTGRH